MQRFFYSQRHNVASFTTLVATAVIIVTPWSDLMHKLPVSQPPAEQMAIELEAAPLPPVAPAPPTEPDRQQQPLIKPVATEIPAAPVATPAAIATATTATTATTTATAAATATATSGAQQNDGTPDSGKPAEHKESPVPPKQSHEAVHEINHEANYEQKLKGLIESKKIYPTGRQASIEKPQGTVDLCMSISQTGELLKTEVRTSSGSLILDQAAKRLVSTIVFSPFAEAGFKGESSHQFCVQLTYNLPTT